jgi:hypothetical protein
MIEQMTMAEKLRLAKEGRNAELEEALASLRPGQAKSHVSLPSGLKIKLKRPPLSELLGGNPLDPDGAGGDDELLKMLKVTRGK